MVTNMLYGGPFRDMRLLQEEVNRLAQSAAAPQAMRRKASAQSTRNTRSVISNATLRCRATSTPTGSRRA